MLASQIFTGVSIFVPKVGISYGRIQQWDGFPQNSWGGGIIVSRENMGGLVLYTGGWKSVYVDGGQIQGQF